MNVAPPQFGSLAVALAGGVATVQFNRPEKANALHAPMWRELPASMRWVDECSDARVAILHGTGKHFCAGIDLAMLDDLRQRQRDDTQGRTNEAIRRFILDLQEAVSWIEKCRKPVIAAVHGFCLGAGLDIAATCDLRYCSADAVFSLKEVDVGIVADLGSLQRLPRIVGEGLTRELAYTARQVSADEALAMKLVNKVFPSHDSLLDGVNEIARLIAAKSPLALRGAKEVITYSREHAVTEGLNFVATWNAAMLVSEDLQEASVAASAKRSAKFLD